MRTALLCLMLCVFTAAAQTQSDTPNPAVDFPNTFGPAGLTVTLNSITLTRTKAGEDAGSDWLPGGKPIPLDAAHDCVSFQPQAATDGGYYVVTILFYKPDGSCITELPLIADTQKTDPVTIPNVAKLAVDKAAGAASYSLRFRIHPVDKVGAAFAFALSGFAVGPNP